MMTGAFNTHEGIEINKRIKQAHLSMKYFQREQKSQFCY